MANIPLLLVGLAIGWFSKRSFDVAMLGLFASIALLPGSFVLFALDTISGNSFIMAFVGGLVLLGVESIILKQIHTDEFHSWWRRTRRRAMGKPSVEHYR